ncbi:hypothetical protein [uncultured Nostoc sp.]|uniref:hypothetical protein n=1 Tax=uncultured Nostoc sp. TaxID=340711 RepID=UPI0035CB78D7
MDRVSVVVQNADGNNHIASDKADDEFRDAGSILSRYRIQEWHLIAKQPLPKLIMTKCKL